MVLWCLASNSDTSFAPEASILVQLGGLEKAFPTQDTEGMEVIPVVSAIAAGLFDFFFCQTNCQPKCFMGLSAAQVRAAIECPKDLVSFPAIYTRDFFCRSHFEVSACLGCGFESMLVCSTPEFPRRRLQCLHMAGVLAEDLQEVVLLCLATNSPWVWRTTLEMTMGMLPGLNSLVQVVRESDFAHTCIYSTVAIPSVIFVAGVLLATCVGMMLAYHGSACDDQFSKEKIQV